MKVRVCLRIADIRNVLAPLRKPGIPIGLVPTMGALHAGHGALMEAARRECDVIVASIFVNPIQFNEASDYQGYPRTMDADIAFCETHGADFIFAPDNSEMYPQPTDTTVDVGRLTDHLCGAHRPGHFRGVTTVVAKLFHIVQPDRAYFGEKDAQQLAVIQRMVRDLNMAVQVTGIPTVREPDGLALSSRNKRLSAEERQRATVLYRALSAAESSYDRGERKTARLIEAALEALTREREIRVEYLEVVDAVEMQPVDEVRGPARMAVAAWLGDTRLIDNVLLGQVPAR